MDWKWKEEWSEEGGLEKYLNDPDGLCAGMSGERQPYDGYDTHRTQRTLRKFFQCIANWWKELK